MNGLINRGRVREFTMYDSYLTLGIGCSLCRLLLLLVASDYLVDRSMQVSKFRRLVRELAAGFGMRHRMAKIKSGEIEFGERS